MNGISKLKDIFKNPKPLQKTENKWNGRYTIFNGAYVRITVRIDIMIGWWRYMNRIDVMIHWLDENVTLNRLWIDTFFDNAILTGLINSTCPHWKFYSATIVIIVYWFNDDNVKLTE